jgi:aryl-alcohol dehydrogenase-like predicted oxidoreductase
MQTRQLGELTVSAIGLGCMGMSQAYGTPDRSESARVLHRSLDLGCTFLDTACIYGMGHNETLIGEVLKNRRWEYKLATKGGIFVDKNGGRGVDCSPKSIKRVCEESLKRLQTNMIDLYYLHRRDHNVPIEDSVGALAELVAEGKIRYIGLSEVSSSTLRRAHSVHPISAVQSEYSLWTRDPEYKVLQTCAELGIGFVPFSPLGRGFLSGKVIEMATLEASDMRQSMPRFQGRSFQHNLKLLKTLSEIAENNGCTMAQLSLAWLMAQENALVPIPGTKHIKYVEENAAAAELTISETDLNTLDQLINSDTIYGQRYASSQMISLDPEE